VPRVSTATPQPLGTAAPGTTGVASDAGHVHALPTAAQVGAVPSTGGTFTGAITAERLNVGTATAAATGQVRASGDVLAMDDSAGFMARMVDSFYVPTDHFATFSGWAWAGAPFTGTPTGLNTAVYPSHVGITNNAAGTFFAYKSTAATVDVILRAWIGRSPADFGGLRIDDNSDDNYVELRWSSTGVFGELTRRQRTGGGAIATTTLATAIPTSSHVLRLQRTSTLALWWFGFGTAPRPSQLVNASTTWTPQRAGIIYGCSAATDLSTAFIADWIAL
jgi:hypothetical protein